VGVDFFYFRASVFNESIEPLLRLNRLRELHVYPLLNPKQFLDEVERVLNPTITSIHLGIMNIKEDLFRRLFKILPSAFPNMHTFVL